MRKLLTVLLTLIFVLSSFAFVGCNEEQPHEHTYSSVWSQDDTYHWHSATCEHTEQKSGYGTHNFVNGVCTECGYEQSHEHSFASEWTHDNDYHWHSATCEHTEQKSDYGTHNVVNGVCTVCGAEPIIYFSIVKENILKYLKAKTDEEIIKALYNSETADKQNNRRITWESDADSFTFYFADNENFENAKIQTTERKYFFIGGDLFPNTLYYYKVVANGNIIAHGKIQTNTDITYRPVNIDGVVNVRDLGGWTAQNGKKVKYGMLYRGGGTEGITEAGKKAFSETLGIKTEIDLRRGSSQGAVINGVEYYNLGMWQYTMIIPDYVSPPRPNGTTCNFDTGSPASIKSIFELLADEKNYPVYFHCAAGADRTGTLALLINGLLGVSYEDLAKDFELTSFSSSGARYRSSVSGYTFSDSGFFRIDDGNVIGFNKLISLLLERYGANTDNLTLAIENYLKTVCGISNDTIKKVRFNLLGEDIDFPTTPSVNGLNVKDNELSVESGLSVSTQTFDNCLCYKITEGSSSKKLYVNPDLIKSGSKISFNIYVPEGANKINIANNPYFAIRVKGKNVASPTTGYINNITVSENTWNKVEINISDADWSNCTEFAFIFGLNSTFYVKDIIIE